MELLAIGVGAWLAVMGAALATSLELWLSDSAALRVVVPAMLLVHAPIGLGEALITLAAVGLVWRRRPELATARPAGGHGWAVGGVLASLAVVVLSPLASTAPDGFERVAEQLRLTALECPAPFHLFPDYVLPWPGDSPLSTILAGLTGLIAVLGVALAVGVCLTRGRSAPEA